MIPAFYDRDPHGIPKAWVACMRLSISELTPNFSANRMVREYVESLYLPAAGAYQERIVDGARQAVLLCQWRESLQAHWQHLRFGQVEVKEGKGHYTFKVTVYLGDLDPGAIQVQLYADSLSGAGAQVYPMILGEQISDPMRGFSYRARIPAQRPASDYTARVIPAFNGARVPIEAN